jgi:hypothetical protein
VEGVAEECAILRGGEVVDVVGKKSQGCLVVQLLRKRTRLEKKQNRAPAKRERP